jgi:hypothetical protein
MGIYIYVVGDIFLFLILGMVFRFGHHRRFLYEFLLSLSSHLILNQLYAFHFRHLV